jgi:hypothetical protein
MQRAAIDATRTIAILSTLYLEKAFPQPEWAAAFAQDPTSAQRKLIPVRAEDCHPPGLLAQIIYIDVFNCEETEAQQRLLSAVTEGRMKPAQRPRFPGKVPERLVPNHVPFPGVPTINPQLVSSTSSLTISVTPWQRRQLEARRETLLPEWRLRSQKLKQLRTALAIATDPSTKFQLEQQIQAEEAHLTQLATELDTFE